MRLQPGEGSDVASSLGTDICQHRSLHPSSFSMLLSRPLLLHLSLSFHLFPPPSLSPPPPPPPSMHRGLSLSISVSLCTHYLNLSLSRSHQNAIHPPPSDKDDRAPGPIPPSPPCVGWGQRASGGELSTPCISGKRVRGRIQTYGVGYRITNCGERGRTNRKERETAIVVVKLPLTRDEEKGSH